MKGYTKDLHIHTYYSDGSSSPYEAVKWAVDGGMTEIAITDHDNVNGVPAAYSAAKQLGVKFHTGIEFSTEEAGIGLHILGYDIDIDNKLLLEKCEEISLMRARRNDKMITLLQQKFEINREDILKMTPTGYIGKPVMARALVAKGCIPQEGYAFEHIFGEPEFRKLKKEKISAREAVAIINGAGGKAVLAHPGLIRGLGQRESEEFFSNFQVLLDRIKSYGLEGLECIYRKHSEYEDEKFENIAKEANLLVTIGSDYHGNY